MRRTKKGFTLTELIVVLAIMAILTAIAVPFFLGYWKNAQFRKNESNARTIYLAAESKLTYYRTSGQWDQYQKQLEKYGVKAVFPEDGETADLNGRIYAVRLDKGAYGSDTAGNEADLLLELVDDYISDKDMLNASVAIEIDIETGEVYSAFYGSNCKGLTYDAQDADGYLTMQKRDYDSRKSNLLGYYSADDTVNVVSLKPSKLRITAISLSNGETLSLNWASNAGDSLDVSYEIIFYKKDSDEKLFSFVMSPYDLRKNGWSLESTGSFAKVTLLDADGNEKGEWAFPLTYSDNKYSLVLDAMMSADAQALIASKSDTAAAGQSESERLSLERTMSTSITRLDAVNTALAKPQDVYATVKAVSYAGTDTSLTVTREYRASEAVSSNDANTMYADDSKVSDGTKNADITIAAFRHLSNIRYYDTSKNAAFTLTASNMDWASVGTGVYDLKTTAVGTSSKQILTWQENTGSESVDFPSVPLLSQKHTLKGKGTKTLVSNLTIGEDSVVDDQTVQKLNQASSGTGIGAGTGTGTNTITSTEWIGLFCEIEGTVENVTLQNPKLTLTADDASWQSLKGLGILAGRSQGLIDQVDVKITNAAKDDYTVDVSLKAMSAAKADGEETAAVGGLVGVFAKQNSKGKLSAIESSDTFGVIRDSSMDGNIRVVLPKTAAAAALDKSAFGIGGIVGYAELAQTNDSDQAHIDACENHANVTGDRFAGGIVGKVDGELDDIPAGELDLKGDANLRDCENDGLILCSDADGMYIGGIAGYGSNALIYNAASASGKSGSYTYDPAKKDELLLGTYVGGIIGYGKDTLLTNCATESDGYVLGDMYVGGIAGALEGNLDEVLKTHGSVSVTTNASTVIGNSYVGGIVGENKDGVTLKNCVNNGVVAGYDMYVGGIVGFNAKGAAISDCASYLSDYDNSTFNTIVNDWQTVADYVGGIAGYNDGAILFSNESESITVKSVSSIVVGENYVGGIAGFNDVDAELDVHYTLVGGRIYAFGNCAGGAFGLNASVSVLTSELTVQPRSVEGQYYVGGVIGADVVNPEVDVTADSLAASNTLGSIKGEAFVGGLIGYQRTYTASQITGAGSGTLLEVIDNTQILNQLLPTLSAGNVPTSVVESKNTHTVTITTADNENLNRSINNIPITAQLYAGGVVGYCEKNSHQVLKDCRNAGNITLASEDGNSVTLGDFIASAEVDTDGAISADAGGRSVHLAGGIISVNLENQVIDNCANTGSLYGFTGLGGIAGLNAGLVYNCSLQQNFGTASMDVIGGIVGFNIGNNTAVTKTYGSGTNAHTYTAGTVLSCSTASGKTVSGRSEVGGIAGWNLNGGVLEENISLANITASGNYAGGIAGRNAGTVYAAQDDSKASRSISGTEGEGIGGLVGFNESEGIVTVSSTQSGTQTQTEVIAVANGITVRGKTKVGGIVGINEGKLGVSSTGTGNIYLTCQAKRVSATAGIVGGIAGETNGNISYAINRSGRVTADAGTAGGITAVGSSGITISYCIDYGNVSSSSGYAGGIVATNAGTIRYCSVQGSSARDQAEIYSLGVNESGAICAVNTGTITGSAPGSNVSLQGSAEIFGGITGTNSGNVTSTTITVMPEIDSRSGALTVGGAVGTNTGSVTGITASNLTFENFTDYQYLGGIVGINGMRQAAGTDQSGTQSGTQTGTQTGAQNAVVSGCSFLGTITEGKSTAGNCYGGIAGINYATLSNCTIPQISMNIKGIYTASSTSTAEQKEAQATHAGGIAGKNETGAVISGCVLTDNANSKLTAGAGMLGGVTGFNKGAISRSGSSKTASIMSGVSSDTTTDMLNTKASNAGLSKDSHYVNWNGSASSVANLTYNGTNTSVSGGRLQMTITSNGNIGGITAYNAADGAMDYCVSGDWFLLNQSQSVGVGTGGIIGMNESEQDLSYLVNGAFVGRQLSTGVTNRFAGGIIGNQNTSDASDWTISNCINYGTVYCYNTHYSGGIMGQWTGAGGTVEDCRNYGNLQTTYAAGWVGASGGIVAQLYHPNEQNAYNIISCNNYGSIYCRGGASTANGANDSAGILGNVTTLYASAKSEAQNFTIRLLDCENAPGVQIYSNSMAAGIFGFMSCDNPNSGNIIDSTSNVNIQLERCRNFARTLSGSSFSGGIFGARYSADGWSNTVLKDCYSVKLGSGYTVNNYPVISNGNNNGGDLGNVVSTERINNYFLVGNTNTAYYYTTSGWWNPTTTWVVLGRQQSDGSIVYGSGSKTVETESSSNSYVNNVHVLKNLDGDYVVAELKMTGTISGSNYYIDTYGYIRNNSGRKVGWVLFTVPASTNLSYSYISGTAVTTVGNPVETNARTSYRRLEGIETKADGTEQILAPASVTVTVSGGQMTVNVTPQQLPGSDGTTCDPFDYEVTITDSIGHTAVRTLYSEEGSFDLPAGLSGTLSVSVRSVSMFDDVENSDAVAASVDQDKEILPAPQIRATLRLVNTGSNADYRYEISLDNLDDYASYSGWQVKVSVKGDTNVVTLNANTTSAYFTKKFSNGTYQFNAQATAQDGISYQASALVSTAAYLSDQNATISLASAKPDVSISGNTLDDLTVTVTLDDSSDTSIKEVQPVYRAELLGTWKGRENVVFAKTDIMVSSKGTASGSFTNLPDYISEATNLHVRLWYASTGLGPVYLYKESDELTETNPLVYDLSVVSRWYNALEDNKGIIYELTDVSDDGTETWHYTYSIAVANPWSNFTNNYKYSTGTLFTWLDAPVLAQADGTQLTPGYSADGSLQYTFSWDQSVSGSAQYEIELTGIDSEGKEVTIDTSAFDGGRSFTADAENWTYDNIRLKVTRVGNAASGQIGLSTTATYRAAQRLDKPGQPTVSIIDENELNYQITWSGLADETYCESYQAYIRVYDDDGNLQTAETLGDAVTADGRGTYTITADLESYAGRRAVIYLTARSNDTTARVDSAAGVTYELEVPERLTTPTVSWLESWLYDSGNPVDAADFLNGALRITLTAENDESIPPGGSAYLLKAYVYDSEDAAKAAADTDRAGYDAGNYTAVYPTDGSVVQMSVTDARTYYDMINDLSIKYAGKWIVFCTRISSGTGNISSKWINSAAIRLPYVKLAQPSVSSETRAYDLTAVVTDTPNVPGSDQTWSAEHTVLTWNSVECADLFEIGLTGKAVNTGEGSSAEQAKLRIMETEGTDAVTGEAIRTVQVQQYVYRGTEVTKDDGTTETVYDWIWETITENAADYPDGTVETDKVHTFDIDSYQVTISSSYTTLNGAEIYYDLTLTAQLQTQLQADGTISYTLKLPDVTALTAADGTAVTNDSFKLTSQAEFISNVIENIDGASDAYVASEGYEIKWN